MIGTGDVDVVVNSCFYGLKFHSSLIFYKSYIYRFSLYALANMYVIHNIVIWYFLSKTLLVDWFWLRILLNSINIKMFIKCSLGVCYNIMFSFQSDFGNDWNWVIKEMAAKLNRCLLSPHNSNSSKLTVAINKTVILVKFHFHIIVSYSHYHFKSKSFLEMWTQTRSSLSNWRTFIRT